MPCCCPCRASCTWRRTSSSTTSRGIELDGNVITDWRSRGRAMQQRCLVGPILHPSCRAPPEQWRVPIPRKLVRSRSLTRRFFHMYARAGCRRRSSPLNPLLLKNETPSTCSWSNQLLPRHSRESVHCSMGPQEISQPVHPPDCSWNSFRTSRIR